MDNVVCLLRREISVRVQLGLARLPRPLVVAKCLKDVRPDDSGKMQRLLGLSVCARTGCVMQWYSR